MPCGDAALSDAVVRACVHYHRHRIDKYRALQSRYPGSTIVFDMSLTYICSAFVGVVLSNVLVERLSLRVRITVGYALSFVVLLLVAVLDVAGRAGFSPGASYRVTLIAVAVVALGCTGTEGEFSRGGSGGGD